MPTWNEPMTREIGRRTLGEMRGHDQGLTDPHRDAFDRALDVNLTLGTRLRAKRGETQAEKQDREMAALELTREGKSGRELAYRARKAQKARAQGGEGRTDEYESLDDEEREAVVEREPFRLYPPDDDYEPEEDFSDEEADPYANLPAHIAEALADDEEENEGALSGAPFLTGTDAYTGIEGSLGHLSREQLGELAAAVANDQGISPARRFALSQSIGYAVAGRS